MWGRFVMITKVYMPTRHQHFIFSLQKLYANYELMSIHQSKNSPIMTFAYFLHQLRLHTQCWVLLALLLHQIARDESHTRPITGTIHRCSPYFFHPKKKMRKGSRGLHGIMHPPTHPLTPLNTTPWVKMRWAKKKRTIGGTIISTETAMMRCVLMV